MSVSIKLAAAQTAYLHAAKHADCAVFGLLLGSEDGSVEQAVPVCHLNVGCSPIVEAACVVVEQLCNGKSLRIVGCYYAPMGVAEVTDLRQPEQRVLQSLSGALLPAKGFTVCLVFSNSNAGKALSVTRRLLVFFGYRIIDFLLQLSECHLPFQAWTLEAVSIRISTGCGF
jgi:hypothetical protein